MAAWKVTLDRRGVGALLKGTEAQTMVNSAAYKGADAAQSAMPSDDELPDAVRVDEYTTDRGAAAIVLAHPRAGQIEAKHGPLSAAARAIGVPITRR